MPRADVVAGVVAVGAEELRGERGARAAVAVDDELAVLGDAERLAELGLCEDEQVVEVEVARARDVARTRVAPSAAGAVVLGEAAHVEERHVTEAAGELVDRDVGHSPRTTSSSRATDGRSASSPSQDSSRPGSASPKRSRSRIIHGTYATSVKRSRPSGRASSRSTRSLGSSRRKA